VSVAQCDATAPLCLFGLMEQVGKGREKRMALSGQPPESVPLPALGAAWGTVQGSELAAGHHLSPLLLPCTPQPFVGIPNDLLHK